MGAHELNPSAIFKLEPQIRRAASLVIHEGHWYLRKSAISEFPKGRKYLISLSFRGKASVRPAQVGGFDVNIVIHGSTAVRGRGDLVAYRWALWKLTAPWTHRTRPPHLGKRCAFSTSSTGPFPSNHSRKTPKGPKIALGNPDRPRKSRWTTPKTDFRQAACHTAVLV